MLTYTERLNQDLGWALKEGGLYFERRSAVHEALRRLAKNLGELQIDYAVAGTVAMFMHGFRRFTEDLDIIVSPAGLEEIHSVLPNKGYVRSAETKKHLHDLQTGVRIDFLISGQYPGGQAGPITFPVPNEASIEHDGIRIVSLTKLIEIKLASGLVSHRCRDHADVQQMVERIDLPQEFAEQLHPSFRELFQRIWANAQLAVADDYCALTT